MAFGEMKARESLSNHGILKHKKMKKTDDGRAPHPLLIFPRLLGHWVNPGSFYLYAQEILEKLLVELFGIKIFE